MFGDWGAVTIVLLFLFLGNALEQSVGYREKRDEGSQRDDVISTLPSN